MLHMQMAGRETGLWLASRLRPEDAQEIQDMHPEMTLREILDASCKASRCYAMADENNVPVVLFGVTPDAYLNGVVWLLATPEVRHHGLQVIDLAQKALAYFHESYYLLHNLVDVRNALHVRWCRLLGFKSRGTVRHNGRDYIHVVHTKE